MLLVKNNKIGLKLTSGAGASVPVGIGSLSRITQVVRNDPINGDILPIISEIEEILSTQTNEFNIRFDIESLYTILDCLSNPRSIFELGPFPTLVSQLLVDNDQLRSLQITRGQFSHFRDSVSEAIVNQIDSYNRDRTRRDAAISLYNDFFRIQFEDGLHFRDAGGNQVLNAFTVVATLNYDIVLELYDIDTEASGDRLVTIPHFFNKRGFVPHRGGILRLDRDNIQVRQMNDTQPLLEYIKLHGSIDWWTNDDNNIFQSFSGDTPVLNLTGRALIYPIYEKHISAEPFFTFYQYFRRISLTF